MQKQLFSYLMVGLIALALGFGIGRLSKNAPAAVAPAPTKSVMAQRPVRNSQPAPAEPTFPEAEPTRLSNGEILRRLAQSNGDSDDEKHLLSDIPLEQIPGLIAELSRQQGSRAKDAMLELLVDWWQKDPNASRAWVFQMPEGMNKNEAIRTLFSITADQDPSQALAMLGKLQPNQARDAVSTIFNSWGGKDPATAVRQLATLPTQSLQDMAATALGFAWARNDPKAALAWASQLPLGDTRITLHGNLLKAWAQDDLGAAVAYLEKMPESPERSQGIEWLSDSLVDKDPSAALELVDLLPAGEKQDNLLSQLTSKWMSSDPDKAWDWAKLQTDERVRSLVWPAIAQGLAETDPRAAAEMALSLPENQSRRSSTIANVAERWARKDPAAAAAYIQQLPEDTAKLAMSRLAGQWADRDPEGATRWLNGLPTGSKHDAALEGVAKGLLEKDPVKAGSLAMSINDPDKREEVVFSIGQAWMYNDPQGAARWMAQPNFPAEVRKILQEQR